MSDAPNPIERPIDEARRVAQDIADQVGDTPDLAAVRRAFQRLRQLSEDHVDVDGLVRVAVSGATRYMSIGRRLSDIRAVRESHLFLAELTLRCEGDPLPHRAFAEASVDLMLAEARVGGFSGALDTYRAIIAVSQAHTDDPDIAGAHAKGAANLVALALEADNLGEANRALDDLARLEAAQPDALPVRLQRGRGLFNRVVDAARRTDRDNRSCASTGLSELAALIEVARRAPIDPELVDLAAEGIFAIVTGLGTRGEMALARRHYDDLSALAQLPEASHGVSRRLGDAAFNLITDLCGIGEADLATLLYGDLSGLSVAHDGDRSICLAHAKAAANLSLTRRDRGDHAAADVIADDLRALVLAHPENMELIEVAAFLDLSDA